MDIRVFLPWSDAARHAYETGNLDRLSKVLRSDIDLPPEVRRMLAALFERRVLKKKRGGQRPMFKESAESRLARMADVVKRLQKGKLLFFERTVEEMGNTGITVDPKSARVWDKHARELGELRDASGRMKREDAVDLIAKLHGENPQTLADYMAGKRGASRGGWRRWPRKKKTKRAKK